MNLFKRIRIVLFGPREVSRYTDFKHLGLLDDYTSGKITREQYAELSLITPWTVSVIKYEDGSERTVEE